MTHMSSGRARLLQWYALWLEALALYEQFKGAGPAARALNQPYIDKIKLIDQKLKETRKYVGL